MLLTHSTDRTIPIPRLQLVIPGQLLFWQSKVVLMEHHTFSRRQQREQMLRQRRLARARWATDADDERLPRALAHLAGCNGGEKAKQVATMMLLMVVTCRTIFQRFSRSSRTSASPRPLFLLALISMHKRLFSKLLALHPFVLFLSLLFTLPFLLLVFHGSSFPFHLLI